jgi:hypothetical protein
MYNVCGQDTVFNKHNVPHTITTCVILSKTPTVIRNNGLSLTSCIHNMSL